MKKMPRTDYAARLEKSYSEALVSLGNPKNVYGALEETTQILLRNLESRIEWKIQDAAARTPRQPVSLTAEMAELERIGRINATLQDPRLIEFRTGDPDAGARAIVRILEEARREYGGGKADTPDGASIKEAPEREDGAGDETRQTPTVEHPPATRHIGTCYGKVRRGSG